MLEKIRESSQGIAAKIILGLVIASFAVAGVGSYINTRGEITAAEVNGVGITQSEFERAFQNERARMEAQFGEMFAQLASDASYLQNFRSGVLDRLINQELSDQLATDLGLRVGDSQIKQAIFDMPEFQVDGKFDNDKYLQLLARAGYQPANFREMMREDMLRRQLVQALTNSEFSLQSESSTYNKLQQQTRDFSYAEVELEQFKAGLVIEQSELEQKYQADIAKYQTPEQVAVNYIDLSVEDLKSQVSVSDSEIEEQYNNNQAIYTKEERRRASHILINTTDDEVAAKAKAEELLAQIKAGGDFAELAKTNSDDTFSGENGGDLDFFERGVMAPEFEEAAFSLANIGDVSEIVQTSFGFHIIKLTAIEAEEIKSLSEVKDEIANTLKLDKANVLFGEKQQVIAELAFEISDSLDDAAAEAGVEVKTSSLFSANSAPAALSSPKVVQAAFSEDVAQNGFNSEVIELGSDRIVVLRADNYQPARTQALDEVKAAVEFALKTDKAKTAAEAWADTTLASWKDSDITEALSAKLSEVKDAKATARTGSDVNGQIVRKAFEMAKPESDKPSVAWLHLGNKLAIVKLNAVTDVTPTEDETATQRLLSAYSDINYRAFVAALKANASINQVNSFSAEDSNI